MSTPQYLVLALLDEHPGSTNADLARASFVAAPTMLRMVDALHRSGLIRHVDPTGRQRGYELTRDGRDRLESSSVEVERFEDLLVSRAALNHRDVVLEWLRNCADQVSQPRRST